MLLGIDIGGTTITFGLVDGTSIVKRVRIPSFPAGATLEETLEYLSQFDTDDIFIIEYAS